jgi:hypothetical protein
VSTPTMPDAVWFAPAAQPEKSCMYCGSNGGHWERVHTGDDESFGGWEDWFCCHSCRDAGNPCETFHRIPIPAATQEPGQ